MTGGVPWDPRLTAWLDRVEAQWTALGLDLPTNGEMRARLVEDLAQALQEGASVDELVGTDPGRFALDVALASGCDPTPAGAVDRPLAPPARGARFSEDARFVVAALSGALVGALGGGYVGSAGLGSLSGVLFGLLGDSYGASALGVYTLLGILAALGGGVAVRLAFHDSAVGGRLAWAAGLALLASGAAITPVTVAFAWTTGYSTVSEVVVAEVVLVLGGLVLGLVAAHELARRYRPRSGRVPHNAL